MILCEISWYPAGTRRPVAKLFIHDIVYTANGDAEFLYNTCHMNATIGLNQNFRTIHIVICGRRAWEHWCLLIWLVCSAFIEFCAPKPYLFSVHYIRSVHFHCMPINYSMGHFLDTQKKTYHSSYFNVWTRSNKCTHLLSETMALYCTITPYTGIVWILSSSQVYKQQFFFPWKICPPLEDVTLPFWTTLVI